MQFAKASQIQMRFLRSISHSKEGETDPVWAREESKGFQYRFEGRWDSSGLSSGAVGANALPVRGKARKFLFGLGRSPSDSTSGSGEDETSLV